MKILYVTSSFPSPNNTTNGIFNYNRAKALLNQGIKVEIALLNNILIGRYSIKTKKDYILNNINPSSNIKVNVINGIFNAKKNIYWGLTKQLSTIYHTGKFDLIHCHFAWDCPPVYALSQHYNTPYVLTTHGSDIHTYPRQYPRTTLSTRLSIEKASKVIYVSKFLANSAKGQGFTNPNSIVIPNGIDPTIFNANNRPPSRTKKTIGFIGSLRQIKGADRLPGIIYEIHKSRSDIQFTIIGSGELKSNIEQGISKQGLSGSVIFHDTMPPHCIAEQMKQFDILILPSRNEGWPCVILEAMACGTPVVGSNNGGIPEAIGNNGLTVPDGELFEKRFAQAVLQLLDTPTPADQLSSYALNYTWDTLISREIAVYQEIVNQKHVRR